MKYHLLIFSSLLICSYAKAEISSFFLDIQQMDRYGEKYRVDILKDICESKEEHDLVIINVINSNGSLNDLYLNKIQPYYKCFNKVFFSVNSKKWEKKNNDWKDSKYYNGIMDKNFSQQNINYALKNANSILKKYPNMNFSWYIHYEANLNYFTNDSIKDAYKNYLKTLSDSLYKIKSADILWSPAFWTPYSTLKEKDKIKLEINLNDLFKSTPKITWIHFQDFLGQTSYTTCDTPTCLRPAIINRNFNSESDECLNTKGNYSILQQAIKGTNIKNLKVNMELFTQNKNSSTSFIPAPQSTISEREKCYLQNNIPIGISFEMLYWNKLD
ncbi:MULTISPECIES: hypothetical protein [Acinetobacter]|uniref:hypothetical protein n=1 Tax=Acinetobacter TaxID=469 RepID=UPI001F4A4B46|nr:MULTISPECIES: hypothetical protein [Acinetobacter]MCH7379973.1 hypothetical protein [Acinetobacter higginsii]